MNTLSNGVELLPASTGSNCHQSHDRQDQSHTRIRAGTRQCHDGHNSPRLAPHIVVEFQVLTTRPTRVGYSDPNPFINAQLPFEITNSSATMVTTVNGVPSAPITVPVTPQAPGVFTVPPDGEHNAIFIYVDPSSGIAKIAAPTSQTASFTIPTAPIPRGTNGFFYATGLGLLTPPLADGAAPSLTDMIVYRALMIPTVLVGGVAAPVAFAGQAPGYPGVNQLNITIPINGPTGNAVPLQVMSADGKVLSTPLATIAIQ
jgi:uncharacterized protein (TIGR03437 family)